MSGGAYRTPRKAELSQHFLRSRALAADLVDQVRVSAHDTVVEIGAGRGVLTREIAGRGARVVAVEIDPALCIYLRDEFASNGLVEVVEQDFLEFPSPKRRYKVVGNLPFVRTAEIMRKLVESHVPPAETLLVLQREAAARFAGAPVADETRWSLLLKPWWHVEVVRWLRRVDFDPPPSVDCVALWMARRHPRLIADAERRRYRDFVETAFGRGGHTLRRDLRVAFTDRQIVQLGRNLRFDPNVRASSLTFDQWLGLYRFASRKVA